MRRGLAVLALLGIVSCAGGKPPVINPTPPPTPRPTPTPAPTPTPTPTPEPPIATGACLPAPPLTQIECHNVGQFRVVIDCTPKTCAKDTPEQVAWKQRCSTGAGCAPGAGEDNMLQRHQVEDQWGPYALTVLNFTTGKYEDCPTCSNDGGNPLRFIAPGMEGRTLRVTGGNGTSTDIVGLRQQ